MIKTAAQIARITLQKMAAPGKGMAGDVPPMFSLSTEPTEPKANPVGALLPGKVMPGSDSWRKELMQQAPTAVASNERKHTGGNTGGWQARLRQQLAAANGDPEQMARLQKWNKGVDLSKFQGGAPKTPESHAAPVAPVVASKGQTPVSSPAESKPSAVSALQAKGPTGQKYMTDADRASYMDSRAHKGMMLPDVGPEVPRQSMRAAPEYRGGKPEPMTDAGRSAYLDSRSHWGMQLPEVGPEVPRQSLRAAPSERSAPGALSDSAVQSYMDSRARKGMMLPEVGPEVPRQSMRQRQ